MEKEQVKRNKRFFIGVKIIVVSFILGWPVLFLTAALTVVFGRFWAVLGGIVYAISWIMLGIGILLAGVEGVKFAKEWVRKKYKRCGR